MDLTILIAISAVVLLAIIMILIFARNRNNKKEVENRPRAVALRPRGDGAPRRAQMIRNRGARLRANVAQAQESDEEPADNEEAPEAAKPTGKIGVKKQAKLEAKAEKKLQREAEERLREEKKKRQEVLDAEKKKEEEKELAEEKRREEEERKAREEKEKREYEEYLKMKEAFSVEEEGYEEGEAGDETNLLQEFINYIKNQKVVLIEDLASHFKLKTQSAIDRIKDLQNDNILTGVIDDRGKFIYISEAEMDAVSKFIKQRGRVSIQELSECSNQLINLTPKLANVN